MNPMQPQMGTPQMSEEELKKLAMLLQQMPANEGLASVTKQEQDLMKNAGGAGNPLPGTQGLGPGGGPVKSYAKEDGRIDEDHRIAVLTDAEVAALNYLKHQDKEQGYPSGNGPMIQALAAMNTDELDYYKYKGMEIPTLNDSGSDETGSGASGDQGRSGGYGGSNSSSSSSGSSPGHGRSGFSTGTSARDYSGSGASGDQGRSGGYGGRDSGGDGGPDRGQFETRPHVIQARSTAAGRSGDWNAHVSQGGSTGGSSAAPPPPPKYKDMNGKEWNTQAEADASNERIKAAMAGIEGQVLTTDSTYERWLARNKDKEEYSGLTDEQRETAYNTARTKSIEDAGAQVPAMVEKMNNFWDKTDEDGNRLYNENTTYDEFKNSLGGDLPANLSEATMRDMFENARTKFQRGEAFTLTPEEVQEFARKAIVTEEVADAEAAKIGEFDLATETEVGEVADVTPTEVEAIASVTDDDLDAIFAGGADKAEQLLLDRISGKAVSPAEQQLKRTSEQNMRMLMGMTAGGDADPAKMRQLKNQWADMTQFAVGEAADLRSQESLAAEKQLVELYKDKDTKVLNTKLANMEKEKQVAIKNGDLSLAGKLANQQTLLTKVVTQANLTQNTKLANLEAMKQKMIEQGKMDMATNLANMQKNVVLAETDAKLAVQSRSLDDGLAMANFQGQKELYGLEAELDMDQAKNDLTLMGFDLQRDLAELDSATQKEIAQLTASWRRAQGNDEKQAAIIGAVGTIIGGIAASDIRAKTNISSGAGEVEAFLDALNEYKYEYKDPRGDQAGMFLGVMAQDLEKTPMGASFVKDTPAGKQVDYGHGLAAILASQANIHDRLRHLEEG